MKIKTIVLSLFLLVASGVSAATPKYVFYFIGDGMGMGHVMAAQSYNREVLKSDELLLMMQFPVVSMVTTYSTSRVTDSAAAGTALSTGYKTNNGMLGVTPDSVPVTSIARYLKDAGWGIGIVTTVAPDDATPGAFYAHQPVVRWVMKSTKRWPNRVMNLLPVQNSKVQLIKTEIPQIYMLTLHVTM